MRKPVQLPKQIKVSKAHSWTPQKLADLPLAKLEDLLARARRIDVPDLVALCEAEHANRSVTQSDKRISRKPRSAAVGRKHVVTEFHFVCADNRGVTEDPDGSFRSGSWIVAEDVAEASLKHGAMLALHQTRSSPSYRQGMIKGFRRTSRGMVEKDNTGLEFHVEPTPQPLSWVGDATGEKGYKWS